MCISYAKLARATPTLGLASAVYSFRITQKESFQVGGVPSSGPCSKRGSAALNSCCDYSERNVLVGGSAGQGDRGDFTKSFLGQAAKACPCVSAARQPCFPGHIPTAVCAISCTALPILSSHGFLIVSPAAVQTSHSCSVYLECLLPVSPPFLQTDFWMVTLDAIHPETTRNLPAEKHPGFIACCNEGERSLGTVSVSVRGCQEGLSRFGLVFV